jgi:GT2 family glycosyltransferase
MLNICNRFPGAEHNTKLIEEADNPQSGALLPLYESELARQNIELSTLRERLASYEAELKLLAQILSKTNAELSNKRDLLHWITNSRSWKMTSPLRRLNFLNRRFHKSFRGSSCFVGALESPHESGTTSRYLRAEGWVFSTKARVILVEAFLDNISLGALPYGQPRPDVCSYPSQAPVNCGYHGELLIDDSFSGPRTFVLRVTDNRGNVKDYARKVFIGEGTGRQASTGLQIARQFTNSDDGAFNPFLRDDLSTAKRLLASMGKISLQSFLNSQSPIEIPQYERPVISILLVLYNRAELTLQCLYSILNGNSKPYEVIIVDNASTDETSDLLAQVKGAQIIKNERNVHYLLACNQASSKAQGEYLLLLNNDAQLQPHTVSAALETFESSKDIGAVGGKIILPDGTLQEAGNIVWNDGSCLGYGRGDSPFNPACMFRRDVDYCSAAFLLTKRDLFLTDGGFDEAYTPAYYEETDYCVRLWKRGKRVVYDPNATVLHYEFASSASGKTAIELQTKHRKIFASQHREWLEQQYPSTESILAARSRQRQGARRILFLDDRVPHIALGSGWPRSNRIIRELVKLGHFVTCYPLSFPQEDWSRVYEDIPPEVEVMINHGLPQLENFLSQRAGYYDRILISRPHNMAIVKSLLNRRPDLSAGAQIIYDAEALVSLRRIEQLRLRGNRVSASEREKMLDEEIKLADGCDKIICVSAREGQEFFRRGFKRVHTLGHGIELSPTPNDFAARRNILLVGAVHTSDSPNADSLLWFSQSILPKIRRKLAAVDFIIAGFVHPRVEERLQDNAHVQLKGQIKDLSDIYDHARVFVAPTRFSAGIPLKIYEAAAHGLPTVATSLAGFQLDWTNGEELLLADDDENFAAACIQLYRDQELWHRLRQGALNRVRLDCSPEAFSQTLKAIIH